MNTYPTTERLSADRSTRVIGATVLAAAIVLLRGLAYGVYILLAAAEPLLAVVLGTLALGCFWVAVIFGFVLKEPFAQRWHVLVCECRIHPDLRGLSFHHAGRAASDAVRLDEAAFALLERTRQFKGQTLEIAKRRLLDGETVARARGGVRGSICNACTRSSGR